MPKLEEKLLASSNIVNPFSCQIHMLECQSLIVRLQTLDKASPVEWLSCPNPLSQSNNLLSHEAHALFDTTMCSSRKIYIYVTDDYEIT